MKYCLNKFLRDEDGNNLVVSLIVLGIIALPLILFIASVMDAGTDDADEKAKELFDRDTKTFSGGSASIGGSVDVAGFLNAGHLYFVVAV